MGPVLVLGNGAKPAVVEAVEECRARLEKDFGVAAIDLHADIDPSRVDAAFSRLDELIEGSGE